jgi:hypothetical protein
MKYFSDYSIVFIYYLVSIFSLPIYSDYFLRFSDNCINERIPRFLACTRYTFPPLFIFLSFCSSH